MKHAFCTAKTIFLGSLTAMMLLTGAHASPLYQGYNHHILDHVKTAPNGLDRSNRVKLAPRHEKPYGPESISGAKMPEATVETTNQMPATAANKGDRHLKRHHPYGVTYHPKN